MRLETTDIRGKSVIVTGGTTGIGRATACLLANRGAKVMVFGRHETELADALGDIEHSTGGGYGEVFGMTADAGNPDDVKRVFTEAGARLGGVDILVNNAALAAGSITDSEYAEWETVVRTNLLGYMACCREAVDRMKEVGGGHIVNIGSMSSVVREAGSDVYVATKCGIDGFSEALRKSVNEHGIKVSLIEPGLVGTDMTLEKVSKEEQPQKTEAGEILTADDIAAAVLYVLTQPARCDVVRLQLRPHKQAI